jgi:ABC-2 type transport system permease protein
MARAEVLLLRRNRTLLFNAVLLPLGVVGLLAVLGEAVLVVGAGDVVAALFSALLLFVVFYTVLSTVVARRDLGVLLRLRTGELSDAEVLTALCAPAVAVALAETVIFAAVGGPALDLPLPANAAVVLLGVLLGCLVLSVLALATATWTRNVEAVQLTALPVVLVCILSGGIGVPVELLPDPVQRVVALLPLSPVVELVREGWVGTPDAVRLTSLTGLALAWVVAGVLLVRSRFRWSPRG